VKLIGLKLRAMGAREKDLLERYLLVGRLRKAGC
jgi:hypothetical protein